LVEQLPCFSCSGKPGKCLEGLLKLMASCMDSLQTSSLRFTNSDGLLHIRDAAVTLGGLSKFGSASNLYAINGTSNFVTTTTDDLA